jgi:hypothetical protein
MFQGAMPQADAEGVGITSGLGEVAGQMDAVNKGIDSAESPEGIMNVLRGDNQSVEERRTELASYVGKPDAKQTPESVLTLLQPTFAILDMAETTQAPRTEEATMRIAMGETPVKRSIGTNLGDPELTGIPGASTTTAKKQPSALDELFKTNPRAADKYNLTKLFLENFGGSGGVDYNTALSRYQTAQQPLIEAYQQYAQDAQKGFKYNPLLAALNLAGAVANAPKGQLISNVLAPQNIKGITDPLLEMAQGTAQAEAQAKLKAAEAESAARTKAAEVSTKQDSTKATLLATGLKAMLEDAPAGSTKTQIVDGIDPETKQKVKYVLPIINGIPQKDLAVKYEQGKTYDQVPIGNEIYFVSDTDLQDPNFDLNTARKISGKEELNFINLGNGVHIGVDKFTGARKVTHGTENFDAKYKEVTVDGDVLLIDKTNPLRVIPIHSSKNKDVVNFGGLIARVDKKGNVEVLNGQNGIPSREDLDLTDLQKNLKGYMTAINTLDLAPPGTKEHKDALKMVEGYAANVIPQDKLTAFERLLNDQANRVYNQAISFLGNSESAKLEAEKARDKFRADNIKKYLEAQTTKTSPYNPNKEMNDSASKNLYKMLEGQRANANLMAEVAGDAQRATVLSTQFSTGFAGNFRVALGNLLETSGVNTIVTDTLKALGYENVDQKKLTDLLGGDIPTGQTLDSVGKRIAINLAESFPGNLNKEEVAIITSVGPSLLKTPKAIQLITKIFTNASTRSRTVLNDANKLIIDLQKDGVSPVEIDAKIDTFMAQRREEINQEQINELRAEMAEIEENNRVQLEPNKVYIQTSDNQKAKITDNLGKMIPFVQNIETADELIDKYRDGSLGIFMQEQGATMSYAPSQNEAQRLAVEKTIKEKIFPILKGATILRLGTNQ